MSPTFQIEKIIVLRRTQDNPQPVELVVTGEPKVSNQAIKSLIENKLENKILFFRTKAVFLVKLDEIKKDILNSFPQVADVEIHRGFPDSLNVVVTERTGLVVWCWEEKCFFADNEGIIFEESPTETDLIKIINKQNQKPSILGEKSIEKEELSKILAIENELKSGLKIPIKEFLISSADKLIVVAAENWEIYFNLEKDIQWQITKLRAVLEEEIPKDRRKDLEYIEVRFRNFAPFKYKD